MADLCCPLHLSGKRASGGCSHLAVDVDGDAVLSSDHAAIPPCHVGCPSDLVQRRLQPEEHMPALLVIRSDVDCTRPRRRYTGSGLSVSSQKCRLACAEAARQLRLMKPCAGADRGQNDRQLATVVMQHLLKAISRLRGLPSYKSGLVCRSCLPEDLRDDQKPSAIDCQRCCRG